MPKNENLPDLSIPSIAQKARATGTDGKTKDSSVSVAENLSHQLTPPAFSACHELSSNGKIQHYSTYFLSPSVGARAVSAIERERFDEVSDSR